MSRAATRRDDLVRRWRATGGRGRKLRGLAALLRPYRARVALTAVALVLGTAAALAPPPLAKLAIDEGIVPGDLAALDLIVVAFVASALVYWGASYAQTYLVGWIGQRVLQDLRIQLFAHLQAMSVGFFSRRQAGVVISRLTNDVQALDQLVTDGMVTLFGSTLTLAGTVVILLLLDWQLALLTFLVFPVLGAASLAFRIISADAYRITREKLAAITAYLQETLSGIRVVRAFAQERRHEQRFAELNDENREANMRTVHLNAAYFPGVEMLSGVVTAGILLFGGLQVIQGDVTIGVLVAFIAALNTFFDPIQALSQLYTTYQAGMAALDKIFELLDEEPDLQDAPDAIDLPRVRGEIRFEAVSFAYAPDAEPALCEVTLRVPAGQTVALVGSTGAGKSTFAKLTARFYDPTAGRVLVDGHDLRAVTARSLRGQMGIVPQEAFLFSGTVHDNIAFGRPDATGGGRGGRPGGRRARVHRRAGARLRDRGGRARRAALRRPAPAPGLRPRARRRSPHPHPRRGDLQRGHPHGGPHRGGPAAAARGPHGDRHRPPPVHHPPGRAHRRARRRADRRAGHPRRAAGRPRRLLAAVPRLGRAGRRLTPRPQRTRGSSHA